LGGGVVSGIKIVDRDVKILRELMRWRVVLGRHVRELAGFTGQRACERRLKKLVDMGVIEKRKVLYGVPSVYGVGRLGYVLLGEKKKTNKVRLEQVGHDIAVLDTAIYFHKVKSIDFADIVTEKQLHSIDGFGVRRHRPDFVIKRNNKSYCVEVELSMKAKSRMEAIIQQNFMDYDYQIWVVPDKQGKIYQILKDNQVRYKNNISILEIQEVTAHKEP